MIDVLKFYYKRNIEIHIDTSDGKFYNGIINSIEKDILVLNDRVLGEVAISISNISNLEKYKKRDNNND